MRNLLCWVRGWVYVLPCSSFSLARWVISRFYKFGFFSTQTWSTNEGVCKACFTTKSIFSTYIDFLCCYNSCYTFWREILLILIFSLLFTRGLRAALLIFCQNLFLMFICLHHIFDVKRVRVEAIDKIT